ncbi:MerR family transcriptional regulator [Halobacillus locisalis]|uniref:MerR family transcriptional regulator n=1 Tax=Halobacillus locisalis TaxID=220753 RepID=A0A838CXL8_9BACI|nr:MerR family transcriptional regulator [Halobacillus locisalis]MBA2176678.1 MerR family transcriptional regulator [Halobacillus locisalis]
MYKVKELSDVAGVSVRTLHHYDDIGLLSPQLIGENRFRYYGEEEVARLQQILLLKEMDFSLSTIQQILDDPDFDQEKALQHQKVLLKEKKRRLDRILNSIDQTLVSLRGGKKMSNQDKFDSFDRTEIEKHQKRYEKEVKDRWGDTDAYKQSKAKTASYTEEDWKRIHGKSEAIDQAIIDRMDHGPDDEEVQRLIGEKRQHITDYFYTCTPEIFRGLADMYVNDSRFTKNIEKKQKGYSEFLQKAIHSYCDKLAD